MRRVPSLIRPLFALAVLESRQSNCNHNIPRVFILWSNKDVRVRRQISLQLHPNWDRTVDNTYKDIPTANDQDHRSCFIGGIVRKRDEGVEKYLAASAILAPAYDLSALDACPL